MNGGTTFKCTLLRHRVTTLDFQIANSNRHTQAAGVENNNAGMIMTNV
jgi:hypothetical protein